MASSISGDFGDAVLVLMGAERTQKLPLSALRNLILEPLDRGQLMLARGKKGDRQVPVGLIAYARLSDELHEKMRDDPAGTSISGDDWNSGPHNWVLLAHGHPEALKQLLARLRTDTLGGQSVWVRGQDASGPTVRELEASTASSE